MRGRSELMRPPVPSRERGIPRSVLGRGGVWADSFDEGGMHALLASTNSPILFCLLAVSCRIVE